MVVRFFCMRHGEKDGDMLTEKGKRQVLASARAHLREKEIRFLFAYYSGKNRAKETADIALSTSSCATPVTIEEGFGYEWALNSKLPQFNFEEIEAKISAEVGNKQTAYDWLEHYPPCFGFLARFQDKMFEITLQFKKFIRNDTNIFVSSHSPLCELAAPDPRTMPRLGYADIVVYTIQFDKFTRPYIYYAAYLPCPPVD